MEAEAMAEEGSMRKRSEAAGVVPPVGTRVPGDQVGQMVRVTIGEKMYQPIKFHGFRIGPFEATDVVRPGETIATATLRLHAELSAAAREAFRLEVEEFYGNAVALIGRAKTVVVP